MIDVIVLGFLLAPLFIKSAQLQRVFPLMLFSALALDMLIQRLLLGLKRWPILRLFVVDTINFLLLTG